MNDLIKKLSDLRSQFNCFDENERDAYHTLSEAIKVLSERPEPCDDPRADVYYLAEKIGIHRLYALVVELRGEPEPCDDAVSRKAVYEAMIEKGQRSRRYRLGEIWELNGIEIRETLDTVPPVTPKPATCEDAVSRTDMLETYADLYDIFEDNDQIREEITKVYDKLNALSSVTPKLSNIDFLMPESKLVFYDNDHGFCINTQDVLEHIERYVQWEK